MTYANLVLVLAAQFGLRISQLDDLFSQAFEGGINYWAHIQNLVEPDEFKRDTRIHYDAFDMVFQGGQFSVYDLEDPTDKLGEFNNTNIVKGLKLMREKSPSHYANIISGDWDVETADVLFQYIVMGEIVFG